MSNLVNLPQELIECIAGLLLVEDLRHLRLTCRDLAASTRPQLACQTFHGFPWRDDGHRLLELTRLGSCVSSRIRSVSLNFGRLDEYRAVHDSFSFFYMMEAEVRSEILRDEWAGYFETKRYAQQRLVLDKEREKGKGGGENQADQAWEDVVMEALKALRGLTSLRLVWTESPWAGLEMARVFRPAESAAMISEPEVEIQRRVLHWVWTAATRDGEEEPSLRTLEIDALCVPAQDIEDIMSSSRGPGQLATRGLRVLKIRTAAAYTDPPSPGEAEDPEKDMLRLVLDGMVACMGGLDEYEFEGNVVLRGGDRVAFAVDS